jgi:hypothetical protein
LVWGGGEGFGGGPARGKGTLEYRTLGGVIPHQGGARGSAGLDPKRRGGPLSKYASRSQFCFCKPYRIGHENQIKSFLTHSLFSAEQVGPFAVQRAEALPELFQEQNHQRAGGQPRIR